MPATGPHDGPRYRPFAPVMVRTPPGAVNPKRPNSQTRDARCMPSARPVHGRCGRLAAHRSRRTRRGACACTASSRSIHRLPAARTGGPAQSFADRGAVRLIKCVYTPASPARNPVHGVTVALVRRAAGRPGTPAGLHCRFLLPTVLPGTRAAVRDRVPAAARQRRCPGRMPETGRLSPPGQVNDGVRRPCSHTPRTAGRA